MTLRVLDQVLQDLRYAIRVLGRRPVLLVTAMVSIGLGVGLNVAVFSTLRTVLFEPLVTAEAPDDLFRVKPGLSYPNYVDLKEQEAFADVAAMQASTLTYRTGDTTSTIGAQVVSENFFEVLGIQALHGRTFGSNESARTLKDSTSVVISYAFWQRLGADLTVVGRTLTLNGWPYTIAGVLPAHVHSTIFPLLSPSVYVPLGPRVNTALDARGAAQFDLLGRLRTRMTRQQTSAALAIAAQDLERRFPDANDGLRRTLSIAPVAGLLRQLPSSGASLLITLSLALYSVAALILLVACANVAGLLVARAAERAREIGIRIALGATRSRIVRQLLAESLIVASLGSLTGAALWIAVTTVLPKTALFAGAGIDLIPAPTSMVQCCLLIVAVTIACGVGPVLTANRFTPRELTLSQTAFGSKRWHLRHWLVAGQVGVSFILLAGATSLLFSLARQQMADPGFDVAHTVSIQVRPPTTGQRPDFFALRDALTALPGIEAVSSGDLPVALVSFDRVFKAGASADSGFSVEVNRVGPRYLETVGVRLLRGRDVRDEDTRAPSTAALPVVAGETFARRYFGSVDVVGQQLVLGRDAENGRAARRLEIVGVSQDGAIQIFGGDRVPMLYVPALSTSLVVRASGAPITALRMLQRTIETLQPGAAVTVAPMSDRLSTLLLPVRVAALLLSALGAIGLVLAMTGLYGVISYAANRRRFELGLRIALGASRSAIMRLMMRDPLRMVSAGSLVGGLLSLVLIRAIWPLLAGDQSGLAPLTLIAVFALMLAVGMAAALRPASRAARTDPMCALRQE